MNQAENGADVAQSLETDHERKDESKLADVDYLHHELANVNRKLEVMHLALGQARADHNAAMETNDKDIHHLQDKLKMMQETVERLTGEKERLYSKGRLRECDMSQLKRELGMLKLELEETQAKARKREDVNAILMSQEMAIKEELREELKEEMDRNTQRLHDDMLAILTEVQSEKKDVAAILDELHTEKNDVAECKNDNPRMTNKGKHHRTCKEKLHI